MSTYLTLATFRDMTTMPGVFVDEVETLNPGWLAIQIDLWSRWVDARLRKRYEAPFNAYDADPPTPITVRGWVCSIVTMHAYLKRGVDPNDLHWPLVEKAHDDAKAEVLEAANSQDGWFELPLRDTEDANAVTKTGPLSYSEASPFVAFDIQSDRARQEDSNRRGTKRG